MVNSSITGKVSCALLVWLSFIVSARAQCDQHYNWAAWSAFTGTSATGTILYENRPIDVVMSSNFAFSYTPVIFNFAAFSGFKGGVPNTTVPETTWSYGAGGTTTMCFSEQVKNPVLLMSSLGAPGRKVTLKFSLPYKVVYDGRGMTYLNDSMIIGEEGYAVLLFPGNFDCVTIYSTTPEYYTNITWGLNPPLFPVDVTGSLDGCDSVTLTASGGSTYEWSGGLTPLAAVNTFTGSGSYFLTVKDQNDCAVYTSREVAIKHSTHSEEYRTICEGGSYQGHRAAGIYYDTLTSANGCDSIRAMNLSVTPAPVTLISKTICEGESYLGYTSEGDYKDTLIAAGGCDSIRELQLVVNKRSFTTLTRSVCEGETVEGYGVTGDYIDTLTGSNGCDSIRTIHLLVNAKVHTEITAEICEGSKYEGYAENGDYVDTLVSASGCDSIRVLHLLVKSKTFSVIYQSICEGGSFLGHDKTGDYTDTLTASNSCDSVRTLHLLVLDRTTVNINKTICEGEEFAGHRQAGTYTDTLVAANGCDSIVILHLNVLTKPSPDLGPDLILCKGDSVILYPGKFDSYRWQDGSVKDRFIAKAGGIYYVTAGNTCGQVRDEITVTENDCIVQFPGAFSPNGDGLNDQFRVLNAYQVSEYRLLVYDRWGNKVFETRDVNTGWTGLFKGVPANQDTYIWYSNYMLKGERRFAKGTVVLLR